MENPINQLRPSIRDKPTTLDLVSSLLDDKNIEMKTEILNPYALATLKIISKDLKEHNDEESSKIIDLWIEKVLKYMVSYNRKSRNEITEILKGYFTAERQKEKELTLTSNLAKMNQDF